MIQTLGNLFADSEILLAAMSGVCIASVLGSGHCAGMCGPIMLFAIGSLDTPQPQQPKWRIHAAYHLGRGLSYTALGAAAGAAGAALDLGGSFVGLQRLAGVVFGTMMIVMGAGLIATHLGFQWGSQGGSLLRLPRLPKKHQQFVERLTGKAMGLPSTPRAWTVGLLTPLLPCGWLYLYVIAAAGTGRPLWGAAVLAAFWAGTLPLLASMGAGLELLSAPLRRRLPLLSGLLVVALGLLSVTGRLSMPAFSTDAQRSLLASQADGFVLPDQDPLCCNPDPGIPSSQADPEHVHQELP